MVILGAAATIATAGAAAPVAAAAVGTSLTGVSVTAGVGAGTSAAVGTALTGVSVTAGVGAGTTAATTAAVALGPVGWIMLGCDSKNDEITWDCWKQIIHYNGKENGGVRLDDFLNHPSITQKYLSEDGLFVINEWQEKFKISYVFLPNGELAAHAEICCEH